MRTKPVWHVANYKPRSTPLSLSQLASVIFFDALAARIAADRADGLIPCFVSATVGTSSSNAMDPLAEIGDICREENLWLHVDAAMSGTAAGCPEFGHIHDGTELADSYCFNPHKQMLANLDSLFAAWGPGCAVWNRLSPTAKEL